MTRKMELSCLLLYSHTKESTMKDLFHVISCHVDIRDFPKGKEVDDADKNKDK